MKHTNKKMPVSDRKRLRSGTTLIEVILAAVIIAIMAVLATTALFYPTRLVVSDARRQVALHEAGRDMERVRSTVYTDISPTNYSITTLHEILDISRTVITNASEKEIIVEVRDPDGDLLVELITERTL